MFVIADSKHSLRICKYIHDLSPVKISHVWFQ